MPETPADQSRVPSYYRNYKDVHVYAISVNSALNWIANDHGDQLRPFSVSIGMITCHSGLSKRKNSNVLKILSALMLLKIESARGRRVYFDADLVREHLKQHHLISPY